MLSPRDEAVVELVGRFRQMTTSQIRPVLFGEVSSQTPLDRTLKRLVDHQYLARLERAVGGWAAGSGPYVYQLGREGWRHLGRDGQYWPYRSVSLHTLDIAALFVTLKGAERRGELVVLSYEPEPACHLKQGAVLLTPDAKLDVGLPVQRQRVGAFLELDRGTERARQIQGKCLRYWEAYQGWPDQVFPLVVFVVPDERRATEIARSISQLPQAARPLFRICEMDKVPQEIGRLADADELA